jgi:predicted O-methyltransferase YrrM
MSYWFERLAFLIKKNLLFKELSSHLKHKDKKQYTKVLPLADINEVAPDKNIVIKNNEFEDGNVSHFELECICRLVKKYQPESIFEIGTFNGRTSYHMAANTPLNTNIITLDLPKTEMANTALRIKSGEKKFINKDRSGEYFMDTEMNKKITQIYADSAQADYTPYNNKMDFIFIDGSHSYEYVISDTQVARKLLRNGKGLILWHDYGWNEVIQALNEFYENDPFYKNLKNINGTSLVYLEVN